MIIVGGGVSGLAAAERLSRVGVPVTLLEATKLGFQASTRNQGWLHSGGWLAGRNIRLAQLCLESLRETLEVCPECLEPDVAEMAFVASDPDTNLDVWTAAWEAAGIPFETLQPQRLAELLKGTRIGSEARGYLLPDRAIRPEALLRSLADRAAAAGVELRTETPVRRLILEGERMKGVVTAAGETVYGQYFIFATGAASEFWPQIASCEPGAQKRYALVRLRTNLLASRPQVCSVPLCVVDAEGLNHIPHADSSVFGVDRWDVVADGGASPADPLEVEHLRERVDQIVAIDEGGFETRTWSGTTVQAMHVDQIEPGRVPLPTVIDHSEGSPHLGNVLSVFPGRASLWVHVAREVQRITLERIDPASLNVAASPWLEPKG